MHTLPYSCTQLPHIVVDLDAPADALLLPGLSGTFSNPLRPLCEYESCGSGQRAAGSWQAGQLAGQLAALADSQHANTTSLSILLHPSCSIFQQTIPLQTLSISITIHPSSSAPICPPPDSPPLIMQKPKINSFLNRTSSRRQASQSAHPAHPNPASAG